MSDHTVTRPRRPRATPVPRLDAALDRMLALLRDTLREQGHDRAAARLGAETAATPPSPADGVLGLPYAPLQPVDRVVSALSLTATDTDLLALALLSHRYAGAAAALRELHPQDQPWPTLGLAASMAAAGRIAGLDSWSGLGQALAASPLVAASALVVDAVPPMSERSLRPAECLWEALVGMGGWPTGLTVDLLPTPTAGLTGWTERPLVRAVAAAVREGTASAFCATSDRPEGAAARLAALVLSTGREPVILRVPTLASGVVQLALVLAVARDVVPVFCEYAEAGAPLEVQAPYVGLPLLVCRTSSQITTWPRPLVTVPMNALSLDDRQVALRTSGAGIDLCESAAPATAEPRDLELAAADLHAHLAVTGPIGEPEARRVFLGAVDRRTQGLLPSGGRLTHPVRSWESLILAPDRTALLREAVTRAQLQSSWEPEAGAPSPRTGDRGLRLLFTGPPGTGKTLAAEVMAHALGRDVMAVNLARLVSKWIGETEKNLEVVFDAAERGDILLFFDEADAVFAKRSEVSDARDRYANLETAYLLGRIEAFDGVVVLSTNLRRNIDSAFARRLEFIVPFDLPDAEARCRLWQLHTPPWVELDDSVSTTELASLYDLSGALIRNAATAASFLAAADSATSGAAGGRLARPRVTTEHLVHAIEREHAKAGLAFPGPPHALQPAQPDPDASGPTSIRQGRQP